jgi:beta-lactamase class A
MTSVVPEQTWGVTAGVPSSWGVAQKNGFAGATTNSVGWVDEPGPGNGYLVAILSTGWPNFSAGIPVVEYVSLAIADALIDRVPGAE